MIETARLKLIPCRAEHFEAYFGGEQKLAELLDVSLAKDWTQFPEAMPFAAQMLKNNSPDFAWGMYFFVHEADRKLVGNGGFKGAEMNGAVEIGYAFSPDYWNRGLGSEAADGLINFAFSHDFVKTVDAHTLAEENASVKVLQKCGMKKIAEMHDAEDGDIWHWRISREEFENALAKVRD